jgi:hypothetical protein
MPIHQIFIHFYNLPPKIKYSGLMYASCIFMYNVVGSYNDSKFYLHKFRTKTLSDYDTSFIKNDWEAVKYGANLNFFGRLFDSIIWPITAFNNIIPIVVLQMNPPLEGTGKEKEKEQEQEKK